MGLNVEKHRSYLRTLADIHRLAEGGGAADQSDLVQEALLRAVRKSSEFRGQTEAELRAWLRQILVNVAADAARAAHAQKRDAGRLVSLERLFAESAARLDLLAGSTVARKIERQERIDRVIAAVAELADDQRAVIQLHHLAGWPVAKVAAKIGRTEASVAGLLRRGLARLREQLGDSSH